ncbi:CPBP family intramembrane metalloprotease [Porifericola rhodea]|uniref:CPBP family intramembrane glutamic endopeptidase n=1 Tax=Porifericola rhodea TaxID=930972 RepID=UPI002665CDDB|nr:CPBP family intramembrane glutamic endopeptidase [Porifericola rhodea]WKN31601.1 CPBP family intramembrane metalloprotease [Porifericola rhodea]
MDSWKGMLIGFLYGFIICGLLYGLMFYWYGHTLSNALVYISHSYQGLPAGMDTQTRFTFFIIFSISSMLFSPIGEEFFYRGFIHENFALNSGATAASVLDSLAFSLVHLAHFGFVYHQGEWSFLPLPAIVWAVALFVSCLLFYKARVQSGSIWGAVLAHAAFNLSMNYFIFYRILG